MSVSQEVLSMFDGKQIKAKAIHIKCVEDIDAIRSYLESKCGINNIQENEQMFIANGEVYHKPWLPRERIGTFSVKGNQYCITTESSSATGRLNPRRSLFPLAALNLKDERTLIATINAEKNYFIEYNLQD